MSCLETILGVALTVDFILRFYHQFKRVGFSAEAYALAFKRLNTYTIGDPFKWLQDMVASNTRFNSVMMQDFLAHCIQYTTIIQREASAGKQVEPVLTVERFGQLYRYFNFADKDKPLPALLQLVQINQLFQIFPRIWDDLKRRKYLHFNALVAFSAQISKACHQHDFVPYLLEIVDNVTARGVFPKAVAWNFLQGLLSAKILSQECHQLLQELYTSDSPNLNETQQKNMIAFRDKVESYLKTNK